MDHHLHHYYQDLTERKPEHQSKKTKLNLLKLKQRQQFQTHRKANNKSLQELNRNASDERAG